MSKARGGGKNVGGASQQQKFEKVKVLTTQIIKVDAKLEKYRKQLVNVSNSVTLSVAQRAIRSNSILNAMADAETEKSLINQDIQSILASD